MKNFVSVEPFLTVFFLKFFRQRIYCNSCVLDLTVLDCCLRGYRNFLSVLVKHSERYSILYFDCWLFDSHLVVKVHLFGQIFFLKNERSTKLLLWNFPQFEFEFCFFCLIQINTEVILKRRLLLFNLFFISHNATFLTVNTITTVIIIALFHLVTEADK